MLVIGPPPERVVEAADVDAILAYLARTLPTSKAAAEASKLTGVSKKELYQRLLDMKGGDGR